MGSSEILVRYNTLSVSEHDRWRFLWNGTEHVCSSVTFYCASETCHQQVEIDGYMQSKWHIRPIAANEVIRKEDDNGVHFIIQ
ncbi:MAG: hypothetical protein ACKOSR_08300 [Flavobacteriales bacterium]